MLKRSKLQLGVIVAVGGPKGSTIVIGGGFAGLSVSCYLAKQGRSVTLLEKNDTVGGRARYWEEGGFRFDMGPSWYLMPEVFERFFNDFGRSPQDFYDLKRLDPSYKVYFENEEPATITPELDATCSLFESFETGGGAKLRAYLIDSKQKYEVAMRDFLYREYSSKGDLLDRKILSEGLRLNLLGSLERHVRRYFSDHRARQILQYAMVFLGTAPRSAPSLYSIMSHVDLGLGVYYPAGGLAGVSQAIARLARDLGVEIHTSSEVQRIDVEDGRVESVQTQERRFVADLVVSAADYPHTELDLLPRESRSLSARYWRRRTIAPSMFIAYLGLNRRLPELEHHNLYFAREWHDHFDTIFKRPAWPIEPCYYLSRISATDAASAPTGGENLFLLVPVAPGLDDSHPVRERFFETIVAHVEKTTGTTIRDHIRVKRIYSHRDFRSDYHAYQGSALGIAHTLRQTAAFRPSHRSKKLNNLFYTGQYTHPGVGVPMTLISSEIVSSEIERRFS